MNPFKGHHRSSPRMARSFLAAALLLVAVAGLATAAQKAVPAWIDEFAARIHAAWESGKPMPQLSAAHSEATLADGYAVQKQFVARFAKTDKIGGFKAAVVGREGQAKLGIDRPLIGVVPRSGLLRADDKVVVDLAAYPNRHIEAEIGYRFNAPISEPVPDIETLRRHIKHVVAVVELPGGATEEKQPGTAVDTAAWNGNAKEMIVGSTALDPATLDVDALAITLTRDGQTINSATGADAAGGQMQTLLKSVNDIVRNGYTIRRGHVLTNGALGKILPAEPGHYLADFGQLGKIGFEVKD